MVTNTQLVDEFNNAVQHYPELLVDERQQLTYSGIALVLGAMLGGSNQPARWLVGPRTITLQRLPDGDLWVTVASFGVVYRSRTLPSDLTMALWELRHFVREVLDEKP